MDAGCRDRIGFVLDRVPEVARPARGEGEPAMSSLPSDVTVAGRSDGPVDIVAALAGMVACTGGAPLTCLA